MKKHEAKAQKSQIRNNIKQSIVTELKQIAATAGADSKKATKAIEKAAKQLAKKLAKNVKPTPAAEEPKALVTAVTIADAPVAVKKATAKKSVAEKA